MWHVYTGTFEKENSKQIFTFLDQIPERIVCEIRTTKKKVNRIKIKLIEVKKKKDLLNKQSKKISYLNCGLKKEKK